MWSHTTITPTQAPVPIQDIDICDDTGARQEDQQLGGGRSASEDASKPKQIDISPDDIDDIYEGETNHAFDNVLFDKEFKPKSPKQDLQKFWTYTTPRLTNVLTELIQQHHAMKFWVSLLVQYTKPNAPVNPDKPSEFYLHSGTFTLLTQNDIQEVLESVRTKVELRNAHFIREQSGLVIDRILSLRMHVGKYAPLSAGAYLKVPKQLEMKKAIVNVQNTDSRCFGYAILAKLFYNEICGHLKSKPNSYKKYFARNERNLNSISYPVGPHQIPVLEEMLKLNINVITFYDENGTDKCPIYISRKAHPDEIDLLYWTGKGQEEGHYAWIRNFSRFMGDYNKHNGQMFWCKRCLCHYDKERLWREHLDICGRGDFDKLIVRMPPPGQKIYFKNIRYQLECPFNVLADFEAIVQGVHLPSHSRSIKYQHHIPCSVGFKIISRIPGVEFDEEQFFGPDCTIRFLKRLVKLNEKCMGILYDDKRMVMTEADEIAFAAETKCYLCDTRFEDNDPGKKKVLSHF